MIKDIWQEFKMWQKIGWLIAISLILAAIICAASCTRIKEILDTYPQDNIVEEIFEEVIKEYTGQDLDLSPFSPEKSKD